MLFFMLFFVLYMAPVLPVARRVEYVRTRPVPTYLGATRTAHQKYANWRVNDRLTDAHKICNNCGGDRDFHKGGTYAILRNYGSEDAYKVCNNFANWDRTTKQWGGRWEYVDQNSKILTSIGIATALWIPLVIREVFKAATIKVAPHTPAFAVEYRGPETLEQKIARMEREADVRDATIKRLETENSISTIKEIS